MIHKHKHWNLFRHYIFANWNSTTADTYCYVLLAMYNETYTKTGGYYCHHTLQNTKRLKIAPVENYSLCLYFNGQTVASVLHIQARLYWKRHMYFHRRYNVRDDNLGLISSLKLEDTAKLLSWCSQIILNIITILHLFTPFTQNRLLIPVLRCYLRKCLIIFYLKLCVVLHKF